MSDYLNSFQHDTFQGILTWAQLDALWAVLRTAAEQGWYLYTLGEAPPAQPADGAAVAAFITRLDTGLRELHAHDHCGFVYVDNPAAPTFVTVFHPRRMGGCGAASTPLPGWTLSLAPPVDLTAARQSPRKAPWWRRLLAG